jgi:hypothetical protein
MYRWDMMMITTFDIFSGRVDKDAVWVETVEGFGNAYELMTKIAAGIPGSYFIVSQKTRSIRGSIDTSTKQCFPDAPDT